MSPQDLNIILPLLVVLAWALVLVLVDLWIPKNRKGITAILAVVGLIGGIVLTLLWQPHDVSAFNGMVKVDAFTVYMSVLFLSAGILGVALAHQYLRRMQIERGDFYPLLLFSVSGMLLMSYSSDLIMVFLALELLSIPLYVLSGFARPRASSEEASLKYFLLGTFSSAFVLIGIALIFGAAASTNLDKIVVALQLGEVDTVYFTVGAALLLVGFGFKMSSVPFHIWAPDVYQGAPSPVTGFMSVGAKAAGVTALLRVFLVIFPDFSAQLMPALWILAALTMVIGNLAAISQTNIKRLLAYSSIAHGGYMLMAFVPFGQSAVVPDAVASMLFYLVVYALNSFGAWAVVIILEQAEEKGLELKDYAGLAGKHPLLALAMTVFMLSFTGMPLTLGFWGKFYLFRTAVEGGFWSLALIGLLASLVSAYYYLRVVVYMFMRPGDPVVNKTETWAVAVALLSAVAVFVLSFVPAPLLELAARAILNL